jgi:N-acetylglucosamine kinase-like BadF-type ATPase
MRLFAGIDGGQSGTQAVIGDDSGHILGRGVSAPADEIAQSSGSTRLRDALQGALADAIVQAQLPRDTRFEAVVAGVSGYEGTIRGVVPSIPAQHFTIVHDAPIAHAGAFGGAPGVVVIAGTGSVAFGVARVGRSATTGGWGYLFGDEGSAFWIVRMAVSVAATHGTCRGAQQLQSFFGEPTMREMVRAYYVGGITRERLASFARVCIEAAHRGGQSCTCITQPVEAAAFELARLAVDGVVDGGEPISVAFVGGLRHEACFRSLVYAAMREVATADYRIVEPTHEPVIGALILSYKEMLVRVPEIRE